MDMAKLPCGVEIRKIKNVKPQNRKTVKQTKRPQTLWVGGLGRFW
jgi:hypothetical protein